MKTIFRTLGLSAALAAMLAVGGISAFAQDACGDVDSINALYQSVLDNYKSTDVAVFSKAVDSAKQFLEKYGTCEVAKQNADWIKANVGKWDARLAGMKTDAVRGPILKRFDDSVKAKSWDPAYAAVDEFMTKFPNDPYTIHVTVPLAWIGYQEAQKSNYKYDANALKYAKLSLDMLRAGNLTPKTGGTYGTFEYTCASKDECISFLTYAEGFITYYGENNKQAALPYYYEVSKLPGSFKNNPAVYATIGDYYYESVKKQADQVKAKIADQKDTDPDDVKAKKEADIKAAIGMLNGYTERAMDAYSRAYSLAKADPKGADYAAKVYKTLQTLYTVRFQKQDGIDAWIASAVTKPLPDPTSTVTPVVDADTSGNSTGGTGTGVGAANGNGVGAANGTGMGTVNGTGMGAANGTGVGNAAASKTTAAKPAVKHP